ncbi:MAG: helix-turn-helix transcriptional regulator [Elusimicrobia bacterium]|nr:helix-turn-helix transcriptional regulator [Elusimicrobiota bacterium]
MDPVDPVRAALVYSESAPPECASWPPHECLRRLRIQFGLNRKQLAAKASVSASLVGRAEKGANVRLSTLRKLYAALGCRLLILPAGGLYDLDWHEAHLDNASIDWRRQVAKALEGLDSVSNHSTSSAGGRLHGNAIGLRPDTVSE